MSTSKRKTITWRPGRKTLGVIGLIVLLGLLAFTVSLAMATADPDSVSFTLEGCRNDGTITLPIGGKFVCPDSAYTTGNLGKGWNELDLVPFRITAKAGNSAPLTQTYAVSIALDNFDAGHPGYDVIGSDGSGGAPVLNTALSDASCTALTSTAQLTLSPGVGGIDQTIYRILTITQPKNTTCVYDWYGRLALGSHLFPGSSLHANLLNQNLGTQGIGAKDVSIPVKEILPQELDKDMSATQGSDHVWDITKSATPATLSFANTCAPGGTDPQGLQLTVTWTKGPADPSGPITVVTHVYATNPASRVITTDVTDVIYSGTTPLATASSGPKDVPANTANYLLLTHTYLAPEGTTDLNDIATATYTDKVTGVPVPGTTTATASADVQFSGSELNQTATINDVESITGSYLTFSADSFSPSIGAFDGGYVAGTKTTGPVSWTSTSQSGGGSVTFGKKVYVSQPSEVTGKLSDTATLTGSDGASADSDLDINISTYAMVSLTINKTIDVAKSSNTSFTFKVLDGATEVAEATVTIPAGDTSGSTVVSDLTPGVTYTIDEIDQTGWKPNANQTKTINLPSCSDSVTFDNISAKDLTVSKTATPSFTRKFTWDISKSVDNEKVFTAGGTPATFNYTEGVTHDNGTDSAWKVEGVITVSNPNDWLAITANVSDVLPDATCTVDGAASKTVSVPASGSVDVPYTCTFASQPAYNTDLTNTAKATWDQATYGTPSGSASYDKKFQFTDPTTIVDGSVDVSDSLYGDLGTVSYTDPSPTTFKYSKTFTDPAGTCTSHENTATFTTNDTGATGSSSVTVTDCQGADLTVSKTATPYFTRTFTWDISKDVDKTTVNLEGPDPQDATFNYTVHVSIKDYTDSDWYIKGTIHISNPNDWEAIDASVSDAVDNGGSCSLDNPAQASVTVAASGSVDVDYTCTFSAGDSGTNTATATWDAAKYSTPSGSASGSAGFAFTTPTTLIDESVDVSDSLYGDLGTVSYDQAPKDLTYSLTFTGVAGECKTFDNTATFTTNDTGATGSASQEVEVCASVLNIIKLTQGAIDPTKDWKFSLYDGPHANDPFSDFGSALASDSSLNKSDGVLNFGNYNIDPDKTYTFCETNAPAGWASLWTYDGNPITPYNPDRFPTDSFPNGQDLGNRCFDFGAGTAYAIPTGGSITFQVDNRFPGGEPRTIGFWKNWNTCTGGGQQYTATKNAGYDGDPTDPAASLARIAAGYYLLDDILNPPGITLGSFQIPASDVPLTKTIGKNTVTKTGCQIAVDLLDKTNWFSDKKAANDAAYGLAAQLLAAKANITAGAKTCPALSDAVLASDALLTSINFDGTGDYLGPKVKGALLTTRNNALSLANTLDLYNNGLLCP
jgi:hypothetical protein